MLGASSTISLIAIPPPLLALQNCWNIPSERLADHPYMYRAGRVPETREALVTPNYMLVYRVGTDVIEVLSVKHTRQQYP